MTLKIRHIATRFALLLAIAAVAPLLVYGFVSLISLQRGTRDSVITGNENVATRAGEEIRRYVTTNAQLLNALASNLQETELQTWQQERILKNYILRFREFRELALLSETRAVIASSSVRASTLQTPAHTTLLLDGVAMSPIRLDKDALPTSVFGLHLTRAGGWLIGELSLEEMWRMVDRIRIGGHGFALLVAPDGALLAHGDPDRKALVALSRNMAEHPMVRAVRAAHEPGPVASEYVEGGVSKLGVATAIAPLGWTVIVEQPTAEAYANATQLERQLFVAISVALLLMLSAGLLFGRSFISPILTLQRATQSLASGDLAARVEIRTGDEFADLGDAFNAMANRLVELQESIKRQERQATIGRIAAGLVHDLAHPIQNLGNSSRLLVRDDLDAESRLSIRATVEREIESLKRFMDDLRHVVKPRPVERFLLDVNGSLVDVVETMRTEGARVGVTVEARYGDEPLVIEGDRFALGRVYRNLMTNAIQATQVGGRVVVTTGRSGDQVEIDVSDTGSGIAPERLHAVFEDFVTTKRHGLGLGLAISKRIVEQLNGTIGVTSELGRGTAFTIRFPARDNNKTHAAAS
ncbi:MAG: ATP-binding protein [Acidobacteriota bacterium]